MAEMRACGIDINGCVQRVCVLSRFKMRERKAGAKEFFILATLLIVTGILAPTG